MAHFYHSGPSTHAPIEPPREEEDQQPNCLPALGLNLPGLAPPPAPVFGDLPNLFKPLSPKCPKPNSNPTPNSSPNPNADPNPHPHPNPITRCPKPYKHSLPVDPHLCLREGCSLFGSIPG